MIDLVVHRDPDEPVDLLGLPVELKHGPMSVAPNTRLVDVKGKPLIVFGRLPNEWPEVVAILRQVKYQKNIRMARMLLNTEQQRTSDMTFGFRPQNSVFWNPSGACNFNKQYPQWYPKLIELGRNLHSEYSSHGPDVFARHRQKSNTIRPEWRLGGDLVFTQGIINNTNALNYHFDRGNFDDVWSCMAVFRHDIAGGQLVIPSLKASLSIENNTFVLFDGQSLLHGVAPIRRLSKIAFRYSVVYYSLKLMTSLGSSDEELSRIRASEMVKHRKKQESHD